MAGKKARGKRAKTRKKFTKKGPKPTINKILGNFSINDRVQIDAEPGMHSGMPFKRFQGMSGRIIKQSGKGYFVEVPVGGMKKQVLVGAVHMKKLR